MPRTKHLILALPAIFIVALVALTSALKSDAGDFSGIRNVSFVADGQVVSLVEEGAKDNTSIRESLKRKLEESGLLQEAAYPESVVEETGDAVETIIDETVGTVLGDGNISGFPQVGSVYACNTSYIGKGAAVDVPWIRDGYWYEDEKVFVDSAATWPSAVSITVEDGRRIIATNGLPAHETGAFPVSPYDDAYAYDRNPHAILEQSFQLLLPLDPVLASVPACLPSGMIGFSLNGVALFSALNNAGGDAAAHEVQDVCKGHPDESGLYHYHNESECISADASGLVGYALDGFGIYSSIENGEKLTNDRLDACHGHEHIIMWNGVPTTMYHYHMTDEYPYTLGCFMGSPTQVQKGLSAASGSSEVGATTSPQSS